MVKAILRHGAIEPVSPLPDDWSEGQELIIEEASVRDEGEGAEDWEGWVREMDELTSKIPPEEHERLEAALADADRRAKEYVRLKMGLP
jgi:hypothetical protein